MNGCAQRQRSKRRAVIISLYQSSTIFTAILFEALPFLLLGSLLGALIEVYVSEKKVAALFSSRWYGVFTGSLGGFIFPTCECAVVPVTHRLMKSGAGTGAAVAFLYAAPVLNPLVLASTYIAFRGDLKMLGMRVVIVGSTALIMGFLLRHSPPADVAKGLATTSHAEGKAPARSSIEHPVRTTSLPATHIKTVPHSPTRGKKPDPRDNFVHLLRHTASDFVSMSIPFLIGAFLVVIFRAFVGFEVLSDAVRTSFLIVPAMTVLAILLSICSEADAFIAASLGNVPLAGQLAFITIGPMIDIKLILQYRRHFARAYHPVLIGIPIVMVLTVSTLVFFLTQGAAG